MVSPRWASLMEILEMDSDIRGMDIVDSFEPPRCKGKALVLSIVGLVEFDLNRVRSKSG